MWIDKNEWNLFKDRFYDLERRMCSLEEQTKVYSSGYGLPVAEVVSRLLKKLKLKVAKIDKVTIEKEDSRII